MHKDELVGRQGLVHVPEDPQPEHIAGAEGFGRREHRRLRVARRRAADAYAEQACAADPPVTLQRRRHMRRIQPGAEYHQPRPEHLPEAMPMGRAQATSSGSIFCIKGLGWLRAASPRATAWINAVGMSCGRDNGHPMRLWKARRRVW
jgi:hypothetical protein